VPEEYSTPEAIEHIERAHELLQQSENALLRFVPLLAAVLAIFAGLSSLYAGRLGEEALTLKNEAVLHEVKASDFWSEYQAESVKAHLYQISAIAAPPKAGIALRAEAAKYRKEQRPLRAEALGNESERDQSLREATAMQARKSNFDVALACFEVSIVLTSIAAMIKRPWLFVLAGAGGVVGLLFSVRGIFGA
jgi:hypothetical protein